MVLRPNGNKIFDSLDIELSLDQIDPQALEQALGDLNLDNLASYTQQFNPPLQLSDTATTDSIITNQSLNIPSGTLLKRGSVLGVDIEMSSIALPKKLVVSPNTQISAGSKLVDPLTFQKGQILSQDAQLPVDVTITDSLGATKSISAYDTIPSGSKFESFNAASTLTLNSDTDFTQDIVLPVVFRQEELFLKGGSLSVGTIVSKGSILAEDFKVEAGDKVSSKSEAPCSLKAEVGGVEKKYAKGEEIEAGAIITEVRSRKSYTIKAGKAVSFEFKVPDIEGKSITLESGSSYQVGDTIPAGTTLSNDLNFKAGAEFLEESTLPVNIVVRDTTGSTNTIQAGNPIPAGSILHTSITLDKDAVLSEDLKLPKLGSRESSIITLSTESTPGKVKLPLGANLPAGLTFPIDIKIKDSADVESILVAGTPTSANTYVSEEAELDTSQKISAGTPLPSDVTTTKDYTTTQTNNLRAGFRLPAGETLNISEAIIYNESASLSIKRRLNKLKDKNPEDKFINNYLHSSKESLLNESAFKGLKKLLVSASGNKNSRYYKAKICLAYADHLSKLNQFSSVTNGADFKDLRRSLRQFVQQEESKLSEKKAASQVTNFGTTLEKTWILNPMSKEFDEELQQEIQGTQNNIRNKISQATESAFGDPTTDLEENVQRIEKFENNDAIEIMKAGIDEIIDELDNIYKQRVEYRQNNLGWTQRTLGKIQKMNWKAKLGIGLGLTGLTILAGAAAPAYATALAATNVVIQSGVINSLFGKKAFGFLRKRTTFDKSKREAIDIESQIREITGPTDSERDPYATNSRNNMYSLLQKEVDNEFQKSDNTKKLESIREKVINAKDKAESDKYLKLYQKTYSDILSKTLENFFENQLTHMVNQRLRRNLNRVLELFTVLGIRSVIAVPFLRSTVGAGISGTASFIAEHTSDAYEYVASGLKENIDLSNLQNSSNWSKSLQNVIGISEASAESVPESSGSGLEDKSGKIESTPKVNSDIDNELKAKDPSPSPEEKPAGDNAPKDKIASKDAEIKNDADNKPTPRKVVPDPNPDTDLDSKLQTSGHTPDAPPLVQNLLEKNFVEPVSQIPEIPKEGFSFFVPEDQVKIPKNTGKGDLLSSILEGSSNKDPDPTFKQIIDTISIGGEELSHQDKNKLISILSKSNPGFNNYIYNNQNIIFSHEALDFMSQKTGINKEAIFSRIRTPENYEKFISKIWNLKK